MPQVCRRSVGLPLLIPERTHNRTHCGTARGGRVTPGQKRNRCQRRCRTYPLPYPLAFPCSPGERCRCTACTHFLEPSLACARVCACVCVCVHVEVIHSGYSGYNLHQNSRNILVMRQIAWRAKRTQPESDWVRSTGVKPRKTPLTTPFPACKTYPEMTPCGYVFPSPSSRDTLRRARAGTSCLHGHELIPARRRPLGEHLPLHLPGSCCSPPAKISPRSSSTPLTRNGWSSTSRRRTSGRHRPSLRSTRSRRSTSLTARASSSFG